MVWLRRSLWLFAGVLALWGVAWLAAPPLLKWQGEQRLSELLGRPVTIGEVDFSPWSLRLAITDLAVAAAPGAATGAAPQLSVGAIHIDADARSLLRLAPVVESLRIDAPRVRLTRTAPGHYDVDDLIARLAAAPAAEPGAPQRFALYNLEVRDGEFSFDDRPVGRQHRLSGLELSLPFVSNLAADVAVQVEPRLAFTLNGAAFDSGAQALPFAAERNGTLSLRIETLDLKPYLGYLPETLPLRLQRGTIESDLELDFAAPAGAEARIAIRGTLGAREVEITEASGAPLLELGRLSLGLKDVRPLARKAAFGRLEVEGLKAHLARDAQGALSIARLLAPPAAPAPGPASAVVSSGASAPTPSSAASATAGSGGAPRLPAAAPPAWEASLDAIELAGAQLVLNDAAVQPNSAFVLSELAFQASQLRWPMQAPAPFRLDAVLRPQGRADATLAVLALEGQASDRAAQVKVDISSLSLAALAPYVSLATQARVSGAGALRGTLDWAAASGERPQHLVASIEALGLDGLKASFAAGGRHVDVVAAERVEMRDAEVDFVASKIRIAALGLKRPALQLDRNAAGEWNVARLAGATALTHDPRPDVRAAASIAWLFALKDLRIDGGRVQLTDAAPAPPVRLDLDRLRLAAGDVQLHGERLTSRPRVALEARLSAPADGDRGGAPAAIEWRGEFGLLPLFVRGKARVERFALHAVQPYVPHDLSLTLARALASFDGEFTLQGAQGPGLNVEAAGDVRLSDLLLLSVPQPGEARLRESDRELLSWQSFDLKGVKLSLAPAAPPRLAIRDATLSDFFARLVLTEDGRLNLRDAARRPGAVPAAGAASGPAAGVTPPAPASGAAAAAATSAPAGDGALPVQLDLGGLKLVAGRVNYSDRFVTPNYSAALTDLNGTIGAYRFGSGEPATLQLDGRVAGTGLLAIEGRIKPGAVPRELDIRAKASEIELAPLSPYSGKYAGYAIERGKLSVEVGYKIDADGRLQANHQLILNQLTFGERVESPVATKLPVLLAVSLLKDVNGVIDIDLPVSGTLSDPQFSVGGLILKVIVNLLTKAITAPFTLLAGSGGKDISVVAFQPGTSVPTADGAATIDKVAKALADRPALKMTLTGEADPLAERDAYLRAALDDRLAKEQQRERLRATGKTDAPGAAPPISGDERARLVKSLYKQSDLPDKPRNVIGMQADIPPAAMEARLLADLSASPEAMRELALRRGLAVRDTISAKGVATERLFLGAPRLHAEGKDAADWTPRVKLDLSTK